MWLVQCQCPEDGDGRIPGWLSDQQTSGWPRLKREFQARETQAQKPSWTVPEEGHQKFTSGFTLTCNHMHTHATYRLFGKIKDCSATLRWIMLPQQKLLRSGAADLWKPHEWWPVLNHSRTCVLENCAGKELPTALHPPLHGFQ